MHSVIKVNLLQQSYEIVIEANALEQLGHRMDSLNQDRKVPNLGKKVLLVSDKTVFPHYGQRAIASLNSAGFEVSKLELSAGEHHKTLASIQEIYNAALENRLERSSTMVAVGGGVIGDMTGFAAATWLRGINFVQVPTTLLAMVDAAIGGKTGVNHPLGKNLIGAFHQPRLVLIDPQVLNTLPEREFRAGMAEVIKYGVIWDDELFAQMEQCEHLDQISHLDEGLLAEILQRSAQAKADVVSEDVDEKKDLRAILNYGHTIGHAVESLTHYRLFNHGEAVAIGMLAAGKIALVIGFEDWNEAAQERQLKLIKKAKLPTQLPDEIDIEDIITALKADKKVQDGKVRFVLPTKIGEAKMMDRVSSEDIRQVLQQMQPKTALQKLKS